MCGRYTLTIDKSTIEKRFGGRFYIVQPSYDWTPTFNAAPSQQLPIIRTHRPNTIELAAWGFWPEEWKRTSRARAQINARLESAAEKPMFSHAFSGQHCIVLCDGYYEWKTIDGKKQPYRIMLKSGEPFAMAGLYARTETDRFEAAEKGPVNFAILTTQANDAVRHIHDRMPVILPLGHEKNWLPPTPSGMFIFPRFPAESPDRLPRHPKMSKPSFNSPQAILPLETTIN